MLEYTLLANRGVLDARLSAPMAARDVAQLNEAVNRHLSEHKPLNALCIHICEKSDWEDVADLASHLNFTNDLHRNLNKLAVVSSSDIGEAPARITAQFPSTEIAYFEQTEPALNWASQ
jgi:hypothetical protein